MLDNDILKNENHFFIDFDGVIIDSEQRIVNLKSINIDMSWNTFFEQLDWESLLNDSNEINASLEILREVQHKLKKLSIITKIHTLSEMTEKTRFLRKNEIQIPIFFVPPHVGKHEIVLPISTDILIDDSIKNATRWEQSLGTAILFSEKREHDNIKNKTNSLSFLKMIK